MFVKQIKTTSTFIFLNTNTNSKKMFSIFEAITIISQHNTSKETQKLRPFQKLIFMQQIFV